MSGAAATESNPTNQSRSSRNRIGELGASIRCTRAFNKSPKTATVSPSLRDKKTIQFIARSVLAHTMRL